MIDWTKSMQQTYKYYVVDPITWRDKTELNLIRSSSISRDESNETLGSSSIETTEAVDEIYIRTYLCCIQNGEEERFPLGTHIVQTPGVKYNGRVETMSMDGYTPLLELKDSMPPYGYTVMSGANIMETAADLISEHCRAPVVAVDCNQTLTGNYVSDFENDSWLSFVSGLIGLAGYSLGIDELGRIIFLVKQDLISMQPIWTFDDSNSSILYPDLDVTRDLYGIPNIVEVLYSSDTAYKLGRAENRDENSLVSIPTRGREVIYRISNPDDLLNPTQEQIDNYADELLRSLSTLEYTVSYSHGYCPVRVGDCVELNYTKSGLKRIKARVISQDIDCTTGCKVSEKAVFTKKLWE